MRAIARRAVLLCLVGAAGCGPAAPRAPIPGIGGPAGSRAGELVAQSRPSGPMGAAELAAIAMEGNPGVRRLRAELSAAEGRLHQAGLLPNPVLEAGQFDVPTGGGGGRGRTEAGIAQPIILGGRRARAVEAARLDVAVARAELALAQARLALDVEEAVVEMSYQLEGETLAREVLEMVEGDHAIAKASGLHGDQLEREESRAGVHVGELDLDVTKFTAERIFALLKLRRLLGTPDLAPGDVRGELLSGMPRGVLAVDVQESVAAHPELALAVAREEAALARVALARAEAVPDATVRAVGGYDSRMDEGYIGGGVSIPVPLFDRKQGAIEAERASANAAAEALVGTRLDLEVRFDEVLQRVTEYDTLASVGVEALVPAARSAHARVRADYEAGRASFLDLMDAQRTFIGVAYRTLEYRRQLHRYVAELNYLKGVAGAPATTPPAAR